VPPDMDGIINNFYDREKDLINRPQKKHEHQVRRSTLWTVYFTVNVGFILAFHRFPMARWILLCGYISCHVVLFSQIKRVLFF
jgi:4-hydroxybenzoate polyprenyltransferase